MISFGVSASMSAPTLMKIFWPFATKALKERSLTRMILVAAALMPAALKIGAAYSRRSCSVSTSRTMLEAAPAPAAAAAGRGASDRGGEPGAAWPRAVRNASIPCGAASSPSWLAGSSRKRQFTASLDALERRRRGPRGYEPAMTSIDRPPQSCLVPPSPAGSSASPRSSPWTC